MFNRIIAVQVEHDYRLRLTYAVGEIVLADFRPIISQGGIFSPLTDAEFFSSAALDSHGRTVVWPGELEFCADALRLEWGGREPYPSHPALQHSAVDPTRELIVVEDL